MIEYIDIRGILSGYDNDEIFYIENSRGYYSYDSFPPFKSTKTH